MGEVKTLRRRFIAGIERDMSFIAVDVERLYVGKLVSYRIKLTDKFLSVAGKPMHH